MQFTYTSYNKYMWRPWFAWHPVKIVTEYPNSGYAKYPNSVDTKITWVWLSKVERKREFLGWWYRFAPLDNNT